MMQFYQKRDFGAIISDTFTFFKENGKNYFKNYILINGLLLILLVIIVIIGFGEFFSQMFSSNVSGQNYYFQAYFQENRLMLGIVSLLVTILFLAVSVVSYSFPVFYIKRVAETGNKNIKADEILSDIKNNLGRFVILFFGMLFIVGPASMIIFGISYILVLILIGFFLLLLVVPTILNVVNFLMFDYFTTKKGFFDSLSYAIRSQFSYPNGREKSPFWKYWGSTIIMYIIIQAGTTIFTMIPMVIFMMKIYTVPQSGTIQENPFSGTMGILFFVFYGIALVASFILMNFMFVTSGLQYYDSRTDLHREIDFTEIDTIGKNEQ